MHLIVDQLAPDGVPRMPQSRQADLAGHRLHHVAVPVGDLAHQMLLVRAACALITP